MLTLYLLPRGHFPQAEGFRKCWRRSSRSLTDTDEILTALTTRAGPANRRLTWSGWTFGNREPDAIYSAIALRRV